MLNITVKIENEKIILEGLNGFAEDIRAKAIPSALREIASGTAREAIRFLSGPARGLKTVKAKGTGRQRAVSQGEAGGYPVPRLTGNLRRLLQWLGPNRTIGSEGKSFSTGSMEAMIFDSAEYANVIHEGTGTSAAYGARPFLNDAFEAFNAGERVKRIVEEKIDEVKGRHGLG